MEALPITDNSITNEPYFPYRYAVRPNLAHRAKGQVGSLLPQRPFCHSYRFKANDRPLNNIIPWLDILMFIRCYYADNSSVYRRYPVKYPR